jgi:hypothetical protein
VTAANSNSFTVRVNPPTSISKAAAAMASGSWAAYTGSEFNAGEDLHYIINSSSVGANTLITGYADKMAWDSVARKIYFCGMQHFDPGNAVTRVIEYDDATNKWTRWDARFQPDFFHAYQTNTCVPGQQKHIIMFDDRFEVRDVTRGSSSWSNLPTTGISNFLRSACEFFPTYTGNYHGGHLIVVDGNQSGGFVKKFDGTSWTSVGSPDIGELYNYALYSPVRDMMYFGGGRNKGALKMWTMDNTGTITGGYPDSPYSLDINAAVRFVDPVTGNFCALCFDKVLRIFNPDGGGSWTTGTPPTDSNFYTSNFAEGPVMAIVAASIPEYGVTLFLNAVNYGSTGPRIYLRKGG